MQDAAKICKICEDCVCFNPKPPKDSMVVPEFAVDELMPMDKIGMYLMKYMGKLYLMITDQASGYPWCKPSGKSITSKEVAGVTRKVFLK